MTGSGPPTSRRAQGSLTQRLPAGSLPVAVATAVAGVGVYGFLAITARLLGPEQYAPLSVLWSLVFLLGPGLFLPLELEVGRTFAGVGIAGPLAGSVLRRGAVVGATVSALVGVVALIAWRPLTNRLFAGDGALVVALVVALPAIAALHLLRGVLAGQGQFGGYSSLIGLEGVLRLVLAGLLAAFGAATAGAYGLLVAAAPLIAVLVVALVLRPRAPAVIEVASWRHVVEGFAYLMLSTLLLQTLINAGPLAVQLLDGGEHPDAAGRLLAGLALTRIPLFLFQAVQSVIVPDLASREAADDRTGLRHAMERLLMVTGSVTIVGVATAALVGPAALRLLFGPQFTLTSLDLAVLTLASCLLMTAQACGGALVAVRRHAKAALGWVAGTVTFVAVTLAGDDLFLRVETGLAAGAAVSALILALTVLSTARRP